MRHLRERAIDAVLNDKPFEELCYALAYFRNCPRLPELHEKHVDLFAHLDKAIDEWYEAQAELLEIIDYMDARSAEKEDNDNE